MSKKDFKTTALSFISSSGENNEHDNDSQQQKSNDDTIIKSQEIKPVAQVSDILRGVVPKVVETKSRNKQLKFTPTLHDRTLKYALENGMSFNAVVEVALEKFLENK